MNKKQSNELGSTILKGIAGGTLLAGPAAVAILAYQNQKLRNNIEKDKEFESGRRRLSLYDQALDSIENGRK